MRAKFQLIEIANTLWGARRLKYAAMYDTTIPEDQRFQKATPSATIEMLLDNPEVEVALGDYYYVDFNKIEKVGE